MPSSPTLLPLRREKGLLPIRIGWFPLACWAGAGASLQGSVFAVTHGYAGSSMNAYISLIALEGVQGD